MSELDPGLDALWAGNDFAITKWPMASAAGTRSTGANVSAPKDHEDIISENEYGELLKPIQVLPDGVTRWVTAN